MPFKLFYEYLPDIAVKETRTLLVRGDPAIPDGDYGYCEMFCDEKGCDCRRVILSVIGNKCKSAAMIGYGWESREYYRRWFGSAQLSEDELTDYMGPTHHNGMKPSKYADFFLNFFRNELMKDKAYLDRIIRHYQMVRKIVEGTKRGNTFDYTCDFSDILPPRR